MTRRPSQISSRLPALLLIGWSCLGLPGCASEPALETSDSEAPLSVDPASFDFSTNPPLLERILSDPHGYFRFINIEFGEVVCERYDRISAELADSDFPRMRYRFNLHGDAHIEQYAITDLGRGLTDFDDSSTGPAVLDLARFGVSLHLAARANGWEDRAVEFFRRFLDGYRDALEDPDLQVAAPPLVARIRAGFEQNREEYLKWVESLMDPVAPAVAQEVKAAMQLYVDSQMSELYPQLVSQGFFEVVQLGSLKLGIGSALDRKFLVRVKGPSADPRDDVVLEIKQVRNLEGIPCIGTTASDPFRILVSHARISYRPYLYLGYTRLENSNFWVHSWVDNYREIDIDESFQSPRDLRDVAYDVGVQLGIGHPKQIAAPFDEQLRRAQMELIDRYFAELSEMCVVLTREVVRGWERFKLAFREG